MLRVLKRSYHGLITTRPTPPYNIDVMRVSISFAPRRLRSDWIALNLCTLTISSAIAIALAIS